MAIVSAKEKINLRLELDGGVVDGKQKIKTKSFTQIKTNAEDEALYNTASILSDLQEKDLLKVNKIETTAIFNQ